MSCVRGLTGLAFALSLLACVPGPSTAAELEVRINDGDAALADAVLSLDPVDADPPPIAVSEASMDQRGLQFAPRVLAVQRGARVGFPNSDQVRHHVYSFSPARRFELKLYAGDSAEPVRFDTPGVVTLGCNIHDRMLAWIVVLDTPWFATSEADGAVRLQAPAGRYRLHAWHPQLEPGQETFQREVELAEATPQALELSLSLQAPATAAREPSPLEQRFQRLGDQQSREPADN